MKALLICLMVLPINAAAFACPLCKDSIPSSDAQAAGALPSGMNDSVYFMLGGFFLVLGLISTVVIKGVRDTNQHNGGRRGFPIDDDDNDGEDELR